MTHKIIILTKMTQVKMSQMKITIIAMMAGFLITGCTQQIPSGMSHNKIGIQHETVLKQMALGDINKNSLTQLANQYHQSTDGPMDLTVTYDPNDPKFTAADARHELKHIVRALKTLGVVDVTTRVSSVSYGHPALLVAYDHVAAMAPQNCSTLPGLDDRYTDRSLGDYRFGCSVDTMTARQIADPRDLMGDAALSQREARRAVTVTDGYLKGEPREPLEGVERSNL